MRVTADNMSQVIELLCVEPSAVDTETTGLEETDLPFAAIFATSKDVFYFDERIIPNFWPSLQPIFDGPLVHVFQNAKFDKTMLERKGLYLGGWITDIAIAARLIRNDHLTYSLDAQAHRELGMRKDKRVEEYIKKHDLYEVRKDFFGEDRKVPRYDWVPVEIMEEYACTDARLTYDLYMKYMESADTRTLELLKNEDKLIHVCQQMERRGLFLDKDYTLKAMYFEKELLDYNKERFHTLTGVKFVNSAKAVQEVLEYPLPLTDKQNPSLTDDVIEDILASDYTSAKDKEIVNTVRSIRTYDKRISTYYESYLNHADKNSIIHPTMWQAGTRTGRFSYSDPNLQNIPKEEDSKDLYVVRGCFKPREGRTFVSFDYSQMEYFLMIDYAGEESVISKINSGGDFHQATADLFGVTRKQAKTLNFAILYGAGDSKLAGMLGVPINEARRLKYKYFMALPKVEKLIDNIIRTGASRGFVTNWAGRNLYAQRDFCYALPNHLIQSGGADIVKIAMNRIHAEFPDLWMVLQIHDQLVFELRENQFKFIPRIQEIMEKVYPSLNGVKMRVDISTSAISLAERDMKKYARH